MIERDYYEVLGLDRQAPAAEIKSQYRRQAKRSHPDLNPTNPNATQQFREVQTAYEVLSDPAKRRLYDAENVGQPKVEHDHTNKWRNGPRAYRNYDARPRQRPRTSHRVSKPTQPRADYTHYQVEVSLAELFKETRRVLTVGRTFTCGRCRGKGKIELENKKLKCERCDGYGFVVHYEQVQLTLPPGLQPDMNIRLALNNDQPEHPMLDAPIMTNIQVTICLHNSPPFEYHDHQLYATAIVPTTLLNEGGEWTLPSPEGGQFTFKIPPGTLSGSTLTLRRRGLQNGSSHRRGNLLCTVVAAP